MYGAVGPSPTLDGAGTKRRSVVALALVASLALAACAWTFQGSSSVTLAQKAGLMEEGSIQLDPDSDNPAADFYANSESGLGGEEEVEDAGPGGHLDGWTQPELLEPPAPEDLASFVSEDAAAPVFNPADYQRAAGSVQSALSARTAVQDIQAALDQTHEKAEAAKEKYEAEEEKSAALKQEYMQYVQKMQQMQQAQQQQQAMQSRMMQHFGPNGPGTGGNMWANPEEVARQKAAIQDRIQSNAAQSAEMEGEGQEPVEGETPAAMRMPVMQGLRQTFSPAKIDNRQQAATEMMHFKEKAEEEKLNSDLARLRLARSRMQRARRAPAHFQGRGFVENCPEGTPGCQELHSVGGHHPRMNLDRQEEMVRTAGDDMVPVERAMRQKPSFIGDVFDQ